jgi:phage shock protein PspC (stress-responsive transcriptional regulator)
MVMEPQHQPLARAARGRWIGGVCEGIARVRPIPVATLRAGFVLSTALAGLGALVYLACWLIIPAEGEADAAARGAGGRVAPRGITSVILGCAAIAGLGTLVLLAAGATVFGFGWIVAIVAGAIFLAALASWGRLGPSWALLPVGALVLPSIAVAASGVHVAAQAGDRTVAPRTFADIPSKGYASGLGRMLVDLRHTELPYGTDTIHIDGGLRRTIVALPHDRCVAVDVDYHVRPFAARVGSVLTGDADPYDSTQVFGTETFGHAGHVTWPSGAAAARARTTLHVVFRSSGGSLVLRDYPDAVDPSANSDWPGFVNGVEPKPVTEGLTRAERADELAQWRVRVRQERRSSARAKRFIGGPCVVPKQVKENQR